MTAEHCCSPLQAGGVTHSAVTDLVRRRAFAAVRFGSPARLSDLAASTGQPLPIVRVVITELLGAGLATADSESAPDLLVDGIDGLTVRTTPHRLTLAGRSLHTWCGFDTVGIPAALQLDATIHTACPTCGSAIDLMLPGGQIPDSRVTGWWPLPTSGPVNQTFCPTVSLFCTQEHLACWRQSTSAAGEALSLTELAERGRFIWSLFTDTAERP